MIANHLSYLDMVVLAAVVPVSFVAKLEVRSRFLFGWVSRTFETLYVNRDRKTATESFVAEVQSRIREGYRVLVFPEGRATFGETIQPFKTGAFEAMAGTDLPIQPIYMGIDAIDGAVPLGEIRWKICWHDPMPLFPHIGRLLKLKNIRFRIVFAAPFLAEGRTRRELAIEARNRLMPLHEAHWAILKERQSTASSQV